MSFARPRQLGVAVPPRRRGAAYVLVLVTVAAVTILGLSAIAVERVRLETAHRERDWETSKRLAESAVQLGLLAVRHASEGGDPEWRTAIKSAAQDKSGPIAFGGGTLEWSLQNRAGDRLSTSESKQIYVVGTGVHGATRHALRVIVRPSGPAYNALTLGLYATDEVTLDASVFLQCDNAIGAGDAIQANSASVLADVQSATSIGGGTYYGLTSANAPSRGMPGKDDVLEYYLEQGTVINAADLELIGGTLHLRDAVLSANSNPFPPYLPNLEGIYIIECEGSGLVMSDVRIAGTVLVDGLGDGDAVLLTGSVSLAPAVVGFPAILVDGDLHLDLSIDDLSESATGINFNPPGTPFQGAEDEVTDDVYPSRIEGLVYTTKNLWIDGGHTRVKGVVLAGDDVLSVPGGRLDIEYLPTLAENPPPGFFVPDGGVQIAAFSWQQVE